MNRHAKATRPTQGLGRKGADSLAALAARETVVAVMALRRFPPTPRRSTRSESAPIASRPAITPETVSMISLFSVRRPASGSSCEARISRSMHFPLEPTETYPLPVIMTPMERRIPPSTGRRPPSGTSVSREDLQPRSFSSASRGISLSPPTTMRTVGPTSASSGRVLGNGGSHVAQPEHLRCSLAIPVTNPSRVISPATERRTLRYFARRTASGTWCEAKTTLSSDFHSERPTALPADVRLGVSSR